MANNDSAARGGPAVPAPHLVSFRVWPEASSPPFAARNRANLPPISRTRIRKLPVHLSAGNPERARGRLGSCPVSGLPHRLLHARTANSETKGHEQIQSVLVVYAPQMPLRARCKFGRHLQDTTQGF